MLTADGFREDRPMGSRDLTAGLTTAPFVRSVCGPIPAAELGVTQMHEHLLIDRFRVGQDTDLILDDKTLALQELASFTSAGGHTVVEATCADIGRDPEGLRFISERSGVNIVMGCGFYREPHYPDRIWTTPTRSLADELVSEITYGVGDTGIRPGIIGEIGSGELISPVEEKVFRAAARAHLRTGLTITTHAYGHPVGIDQLALLTEEGVDPHRVIIGHADSVGDIDYHRQIVLAGAWVQFDLIRRTDPREINERVEMITELLSAGMGNRLLLSLDICARSQLSAYGGPGYGYLLRQFIPHLQSAGVRLDDLKRIMTTNPQQALTGIVDRLSVASDVTELDTGWDRSPCNSRTRAPRMMAHRCRWIRA